MPEIGDPLYGHPGEPVATVSMADLKSAWQLYQDIKSQHPVSIPEIGLIERVCGPGADIRAVVYRLQMLGFLEILNGDRLAAWKQNGRPHEAVFSVVATIPMKWMEVGVSQSSLPFDVDTFFQEVQKESP